MTGKTDRHFLFEVNLNWVKDKEGLLSATDAIGTINVATPPKFGGTGHPWTAEHFFLSSINSCFMATFIAFTKKIDFEILNFECNSIGQIEIIEGKYKFTSIDLYPKIYIANESLREKANLALEKSIKYCLIGNSINADKIYHSQVIIGEYPSVSLKKGNIRKLDFSIEEAKEIGENIGIDFTQYQLKEFRRGLEIELEHGNNDMETNITNDNYSLTAKIALAHLKEIPDYYTRLDKMEKEAEIIINNK
jgi:organic hydroperoxide reductase OsmC/OhrA